MKKGDAGKIMITQDSYKKSHETLSILLRYPPFSTERNEEGLELSQVAGREIMEYNTRVIEPLEADGTMNWELEGEPLQEYRDKWAEEIEEAELFQSRYGEDFAAARDAVLGDD